MTGYYSFLAVLTLIITVESQANAESISGMDSKIWKESTPSSDIVKWEQISPGNGGTCWYLRIHPTDPDTVIESCDMGSTNISSDGSKSYQSVNDPDWTFPRLHYLNGIDFCIAKPETGYAVSDQNGAFKTSDKGKTWEPLSNDIIDNIYGKKAPMSAVAVNPDNPDEVWIGTGNLRIKEMNGKQRLACGMITSKDGGKTWTHINNAFPSEAMLRKLIIAPASWNAGKLMIAGTDSGIYLSKDGGVSWTKKAGAEKKCLPHDEISDIDAVFNTVSKKITLAACLDSQISIENDKFEFKGGVWKSYDLGETWTDATGNLKIPGELFRKNSSADIFVQKLLWREFLSIPENKNLYAEMLQDVRKRNEAFFKKWKLFTAEKSSAMNKRASETLKKSPFILPDFHNIRIDPRNSEVIYTSIHTMCIPYGVWKTTDGGKNWICTVRAAQGWSDPAWTMYRPANKPVFNVKQVWTEKQPMNWGAPNAKFGFWDIRTFDISKSNPDVLYFHSHRVTYRSDDGADTWHDASNHFVPGTDGAFAGNGNSNMCVFDMAIHPENPNKMLFWMADCGIKTSSDGGKSMKTLKDASFGSNQWICAAALDPDNENKFYMIYGCRDWLSNLGGTYFLESNDFGKSCKDVKSDADGKFTLPPKMTDFDWNVNTLLIDPRSPKDKRRFIAAHSIINRVSVSSGGDYLTSKDSKGIFISEDGGKTWAQSNKGFGNSLNIVSLIADPKNFDLLYASVFMRVENGKAIPGGLFVSRDSGKSWSKIESLPLINVDQTVLASDGSIYASGGYGTTSKEWDNNGGIYRSMDNGKTWQQILAAPCVPVMAVCPTNPKLIYCAIDSGKIRNQVKGSGIWRSNDAGKTWQRVNKGMSTNFSYTMMKFNPFAKGEIWIGTYATGYYKTIDPEG